MPLFKRKREEPEPGSGRREAAGPGFSKVITGSGNVIGFWFANPGDARNSGLIEAVIARFELWHWLSASRRVVANTVDGRGGLFVMFGDHPAPGETDPRPGQGGAPTGSGRTLEVNGASYPLHEDFDAFGRDAAAGSLSLLKTTLPEITLTELSRLQGFLIAAFGKDSPQADAIAHSGVHCLSCFQGYSAKQIFLREYLKGFNVVSMSPMPSEITACPNCGSTDAVWIYDPSARENEEKTR